MYIVVIFFHYKYLKSCRRKNLFLCTISSPYESTLGGLNNMDALWYANVYYSKHFWTTQKYKTLIEKKYDEKWDYIADGHNSQL